MGPIILLPKAPRPAYGFPQGMPPAGAGRYSMVNSCFASYAWLPIASFTETAIV
jgi:hypothetical protein